MVTHRTLETDEEGRGDRGEEVETKKEDDSMNEDGDQEEDADQEFKPVKEMPDKDAELKEQEWVKEEMKKNKKVSVMFDTKNVTEKELSAHFGKYGVVEEVYLLPPFHNYATVTFVSEATASLSGARRAGGGGRGSGFTSCSGRWPWAATWRCARPSMSSGKRLIICA